jgi:hypothetical protein
MRRRNTDDLISSQKTIAYNPYSAETENWMLRQHERLFEGLQSHMLIEDITAQVMPFSGWSRKQLFRAEIVPESPAVASIVASALKARDGGPNDDLQSAVCDFVRDCAQSMATFGEAVYELVYKSHRESHEIVAFQFESVHPFTVRPRGRGFVQLVPQTLAERRNVPLSIALRADEILVFQLPTPLRGQLEGTMKSLALLSEQLVPEFVMSNFAEAAPRFHYDSTDQLHSHKLALAEAGKAIGWNARGLAGDDMLEFYSLRRQLSFERFKVELRNSIVDTLNKGLRIAGERMRFEGQVRIDGLPAIRDVEDAISQLEAGSKPFGEILKPFLFH